MSTGSSFDEVMAGLDAGDQEAARRIYERFVDALVRVAARRLDPRLGAKVDPESVALSAFESFFERHRRAEWDVRDWGMVYGLLAHIAAMKALRRNRDFRRQRRDDRGPGGSPPVGFEDWQACARGPGPEDEAMIADLLGAVLGRFDPGERAVIEAVMAGEGTSEVARRVNLSARSVQRTVERFRKQLLGLAGS